MDKEAVRMERERQAFEAWARRVGHDFDLVSRDMVGNYRDSDAYLAFEAWQAALTQQPAAQAVGDAHDDPAAVAERIRQWLGKYGCENTASLLLYEAMRALQANHALQPSAQQAEPTHLQRWSRVIKELPMAEQPAEEARGVDALTRFRYAERDGMVEDRAMGEWVLLDAVKALLAGPAAADARTQSGAHGLAPIHIGNLTTLNQDTYPGLGDWWVQLRIGPDFDEVLARVYGKSPEQARERAAILARAASEPRAEGLDAAALAGAIRERILNLPRYSFWVLDGGVRRVPDEIGRWIERDAAAALCEPEELDAALAAQKKGA